MLSLSTTLKTTPAESVVRTLVLSTMEPVTSDTPRTIASRYMPSSEHLIPPEPAPSRWPSSTAQKSWRGCFLGRRLSNCARSSDDEKSVSTMDWLQCLVPAGSGISWQGCWQRGAGASQPPLLSQAADVWPPIRV